MRRIWWVVGVMAVVFGLLASVGPGVGAIEDAADWLRKNPVPLVAFGALLLGGLLFLIGRKTASWGLTAGHRDADRETYADLVELVPRNVISFLEEHDFGNAWSGNVTRPIYELVETRNAVEHQFHERSLEKKRKQFLATSKAFADALAGYSSPGRHGDFFELNEKDWVRSHPSGDETYLRFESHRRELNTLADSLVAAYNALVATARRRLPGT